MSDRRKLQGGLDRTASWVYFDEGGRLVVEFFDHSSEAEQWFGNDVAILVKVAVGDRPKVEAGLFGAGRGKQGRSDEAVLAALDERFSSYFEVTKWLDELEIPYEKEFDPWA